ncbi:C/H/G cyclin [Neoconidiobolus thromboides FSU 785]|nr:C/H/G cyclin [Neoconidiobolus thromboides FSU 785]
MASNYWESSQYKRWTFKEVLSLTGPSKDLKFTTKDEYTMIHTYFANMLTRIGQRLLIRQKHIATSIMFFKRFYTKNSFCDTEPCLVATTCMYVAGKVDEYPYHITNVMTESITAFQESEPSIKLPYDTSDLADFEFYLLQELECYLTPFHPYHPFSLYLQTVPIDQNNLQLAWYIINDMYMTDVILCHSPHLLAVTAIYMVLPKQEEMLINKTQNLETMEKIQSWFIEIQVDLEEVAIVTQKMFHFYALYKEKFSNLVALQSLKVLQDNYSRSLTSKGNGPHETNSGLINSQGFPI